MLVLWRAAHGTPRMRPSAKRPSTSHIGSGRPPSPTASTMRRTSTRCAQWGAIWVRAPPSLFHGRGYSALRHSIIGPAKVGRGSSEHLDAARAQSVPARGVGAQEKKHLHNAAAHLVTNVQREPVASDHEAKSVRRRDER